MNQTIDHDRQQAMTTRVCPKCYGELVRCCGRLGCQECGFAVGEHEPKESERKERTDDND